MKPRLDSWWKVPKASQDVSVDRIKAALTVVNPDYASREERGLSVRNVPKFVELYDELGEYYLFPRAMADQYPQIDNEDAMVYGKKVNFKFRYPLRDGSNGTENQVPFHQTLLDQLRMKTGIVGQAGAGFGKTAVSLKLIADLGVTTLIVVHKQFLVNQWLERIEQFMDIDPDRIGIIQQDRCDYEGKAIVVALVQSLTAREYPADMYRYFGAIVFDEVHRFGSEQFQKAIPMFPARYRLGVTATPDRKDGMEDVFFKHIGPIGARGEARKLKAKVVTVKGPLTYADERQFIHPYTKRPDMNKIYDYIVGSDANNRFLARLIVKSAVAGRQAIVFSHRRQHLKDLETFIQQELDAQGQRYTIGYYVGGMKEADLRIAATRHVVLATYSMASEGLDIPSLNTMFMCTPLGKRHVEQVTGRILRDPSTTIEPMVVDVSYPFCNVTSAMAHGRMGEYRRLGYHLPDPKRT